MFAAAACCNASRLWKVQQCCGGFYHDADILEQQRMALNSYAVGISTTDLTR